MALTIEVSLDLAHAYPLLQVFFCGIIVKILEGTIRVHEETILSLLVHVKGNDR